MGRKKERKKKKEGMNARRKGRAGHVRGRSVRRTRHGDIRPRERASEGTNETLAFRAEEKRGVRTRGWPRAQIPHENSTIAHLPPVDTEHSRGALTYRVRHI